MECYQIGAVSESFVNGLDKTAEDQTLWEEILVLTSWDLTSSLLYWYVLLDTIFSLFFIPSIQSIDIDNGSGDNLPARQIEVLFHFHSTPVS